MIDRKFIFLCSFFVIVLVAIAWLGFGSINKERAKRLNAIPKALTNEVAESDKSESERVAREKAESEKAARKKSEREKIARSQRAVSQRAKVERVMQERAKEDVARAKKEARDKEEERWDKDRSIMASIIAKDYVKTQLKAPRGAKFPFLGGNCLGIKSTQFYTYKNYVDAQNSFGAMIRTNFIVELEYLGGNDSDHRNWNILNFVTW